MGGDLSHESSGFQRFAVNLLKAGNVSVPFQQRGRWAGPAQGVLVEFPDRIDDRMVVRVEDIFAIAAVAGDVKLGHALGGDVVDIFHGIEPVVAGGDVDIIDIEQNAAIG